jgi:hypothetical protein
MHVDQIGFFIFSSLNSDILVTAPQVASLGSQFIPTPVDMSVKDPLSQHTFVITTQPLPHTDTAAIAQSYANLRWMHANGVLSPDKPDAASTLSDYDHEEHRDDRDDEITFGSQAPSVLSASALISQSRIVPLRQSTALATLDLNGVQMEQRVSEFVKQLELFISDPPDSAYMSKLVRFSFSDCNLKNIFFTKFTLPVGAGTHSNRSLHCIESAKLYYISGMYLAARRISLCG